MRKEKSFILSNIVFAAEYFISHYPTYKLIGYVDHIYLICKWNFSAIFFGLPVYFSCWQF